MWPCFGAWMLVGILQQAGRKTMCVISLHPIPEKFRHCTALLVTFPSCQRSSGCFWFWLVDRHKGAMSIAPASHPCVCPSAPGISTMVRATEPGLLCKQHFFIAKITTLYQTIFIICFWDTGVRARRLITCKQIITSVWFEWLHPQTWQRILNCMLQ